jgi:hypothetical protein
MLRKSSGRHSEAKVKGDDKRMRRRVAICAAGNRRVICFRLGVEAHYRIRRRSGAAPAKLPRRSRQRA